MSRHPPRPGESESLARENVGRPSLQIVARLAGVSLGTASNVLNRPHMVAESTRRRVLDAMTQLDYVPNSGARQLRQGRSHLIGIVVLDISNPFWGEIVRGAEAVAFSAGYVTIVCNAAENPEKEERALVALEERRVDGLLISPVCVDEARLARLQRDGINVILLDYHTNRDDLRSVAVDDVKGASLAIDHLLSLGHTEIAFVNGQLDIRWCADRQKGVREALLRSGIDPAEHLLEVNKAALTAAEGEAAVDEVLARTPQPTAIFCGNDMLALGVLRGLTKRGVRVPDDIALIGYDDADFAALLSPPLSTIRQLPYDMGHTAARLMLDAASGSEPELPRHVTFDPRLVVRASTGAPTALSAASAG